MGPALRVLLSILLVAICTSIASGAGASIVPAGTVLNVRTTQPLAAVSSQAGMTVTGVVDDPVAVDGLILEPEHRFQVELRRPYANAHLGKGMPGFLEQFGSVQQCL